LWSKGLERRKPLPGRQNRLSQCHERIVLRSGMTIKLTTPDRVPSTRQCKRTTGHLISRSFVYTLPEMLFRAKQIF